MDTYTKNIIIEIDNLPKDIKNIVIDYNERPITINITFDIDYITYGQLFIDIIAENRYKITTNGILSSHDGGVNDIREYKQLSCFFTKKSLKFYIKDRLKYKFDNMREGMDTVDNVNICFINTKNYGYKNFNGDEYNEVIYLEIQSLNKILEYGNDNDLVTDDDTDKYCLRVMDILDKYLDVQPDIII